MPHRHIMLFDLYTTGHHATYFWQLVRYWVEHDLHGQLSLVVPPSYETAHPNLLAFVRAHSTNGLSLHILAAQPNLTNGQGLRALVYNDWLHGRIAQDWIERLRPTHVLFLLMDHAQFSLGASLRFNFPVQLSGILFRPTLHYPSLGILPSNFSEKLWHLRKQFILRFATRNPHLKHIFSLDPYATDSIQQLNPKLEAVSLPDGITLTSPSLSTDSLRERLGIFPDRSVVLFFGVVSERKGIYKLFESLQHLSKAQQKRFCIVIAGRAPAEEEKSTVEFFTRVQAQTDVQLIWDNSFIPDEEIQDYFRAADLALVLYQHHIGSSHILIRAASTATPSLGSSYGIVGIHIKRHRLGQTLDASNPRAIANALADWVVQGSFDSFDAEKAHAFAHANDVSLFASTLFDAFT